LKIPKKLACRVAQNALAGHMRHADRVFETRSLQQ